MQISPGKRDRDQSLCLLLHFLSGPIAHTARCGVAIALLLLLALSAGAQVPATVQTTMQQKGGNPAHAGTLLDRQIFLAYSTTPDVYDTIVIGTVSHGNLSYSLSGGSGAGVSSLNGAAGAVSLLAGTGIGISLSGSSITVSNSGVTAFNSLAGAVSLVAGTNVALSTSGNTITINASGSGTSGVPSVNGITSAVTIAAGSNISLAVAGSTITISGTGGGSSGVSSITNTSAATGALTFGGTTGQIALTQSGTSFTWSLPGIVSANSISSNLESLSYDATGRITGASAGVRSIAGGGTGQTTAANAINALLPAQSSGVAGDVLTTNGSTASWQAPATGSGGGPSGVTAGTYTDANLTVNTAGAVTSATNGTVDRITITATGTTSGVYPSSSSVRRVYIFLNASAGAVTYMLPNVTQIYNGPTEVQYYIQRIDTSSNLCLVIPSSAILIGHSANTIAGQSSVVMAPAPTGTKAGAAYMFVPLDVDDWAQM